MTPKPAADTPQNRSSELKPKLVIFDLDYTLWPFWCDTHVQPPLQMSMTGDAVTDSSGDQFSFYRDVPDILREIRDDPNMAMCVASRTYAPTIAQKLLSILRIDDTPSSTFFQYTAWGTGSKVRHIQELHLHTGVDYKDMVFFDDEARNRDVERKLGVLFVQVGGGLTRQDYERGLEMWRARHRNESKSPRGNKR